MTQIPVRNCLGIWLGIWGLSAAFIGCVSPPPYPKILRSDVAGDGDDVDVEQAEIPETGAADAADVDPLEDATDGSPDTEVAPEDVPILKPGICEQVSCDEAGLCKLAATDNGTPCDDKDPCTLDDTCQSGACQPGEPAYSERFFGGDNAESVVIVDALVTPTGRRVAVGAKRSADASQLRPVVLMEATDGSFEEFDPAPLDKRGGYTQVSTLSDGAIVVSGIAQPSELTDYADEIAVQVLTGEGAPVARWDTSELLLESVEMGKMRVSPSGTILLAWRGRTLSNPLAPSLSARLTLLSYTGFLSPAVTSELFVRGQAATSVDGLARGALGGYAAGGSFVDPTEHWFAWLDEKAEETCSVDLGAITIAAIEADPSGDVIVLGTMPLGGAKPAFYVARFGSDCKAHGTWTTSESPFDTPTALVHLGDERWSFVGYSQEFEPSLSARAGTFWLDLKTPTTVVRDARRFRGQAGGGDWSVWGVYGAVKSSGTHVLGFGVASDPSQNAGLGWLFSFAPLADSACWPSLAE